MSWISILASIVAAIGALWIALGDRKASKGAKIVAGLIAFASVISIVQNFRSAQNQAAFEREMRLKAEKTLLNLTGGEGFTKVMIAGLDDSTPNANSACLVVRNDNPHPLYEISLNISDLEMRRQLESQGVPTDKSFFRSLKSLGPFSLGPNQVKYFMDWKIPSGGRLSYGINVTARNGAWFQALRSRHDGTKWTSAWQVMKGRDIVAEKIDPEYPRDANGFPIWREN